VLHLSLKFRRDAALRYPCILKYVILAGIKYKYVCSYVLRITRAVKCHGRTNGKVGSIDEVSGLKRFYRNQ
jgi:hypothetical protein